MAKATGQARVAGQAGERSWLDTRRNEHFLQGFSMLRGAMRGGWLSHPAAHPSNWCMDQYAIHMDGGQTNGFLRQFR
jgi:hypothetical protein